jgi:tight adherence protein B
VLLAGAFLAAQWPVPLGVRAAVALLFALAPLLLVRRARARRLVRIEQQLPEAADFIARALRAGHSFTNVLQIVGNELSEPLSGEFRIAREEINYGVPMSEALYNMAARIPLTDLRYLIIAVLIQRETGGNLAEILDNLAYVIRERFKIRRQIRVHTAHGRFTAWVLLSLPAALAVALTFINPDHMALLFHEHMGQMMILGAIVMQTTGYFWIRKVIKIEV